MDEVIRVASAGLERLFSDPQVLGWLPPTTPWTRERGAWLNGSLLSPA